MLSQSFAILSPCQRSNTSCVHMLVTQLPFWYMGHVWISIVSRITDIHFEQDNCLGAKQPSPITMALVFKAVLVCTVFHFGCVLMAPPNSCRIYHHTTFSLPHKLSRIAHPLTTWKDAWSADTFLLLNNATFLPINARSLVLHPLDILSVDQTSCSPISSDEALAVLSLAQRTLKLLPRSPYVGWYCYLPACWCLYLSNTCRQFFWSLQMSLAITAWAVRSVKPLVITW